MCACKAVMMTVPSYGVSVVMRYFYVRQYMARCHYGKGVDLTGLLGGGHKKDWESGGRKSPSGVQGQSPGRGSVPQELKLFCETQKLH